jgi:hypothetical protein
MRPAMTSDELRLFTAFLTDCDDYVEFGSGGSTVLAAGLVGRSVTSIDSSVEWLDRVKAACLEQKTKVQPKLIHIDIGPTGEWGFPVDAACKPRWADYHAKIWEQRVTRKADLYLVDGRFRVACGLQVLLHAGPEAHFLVHDFADRPQYHVIREFACAIATTERLTVFRPRSDFDRSAAAACLVRYQYDPA